MFFDGVLPRFSLFGVVPCSRNRPKKFSSCQVSCFGFVLSFLGFLSASFWFSCGSEFCQAIFFRCFAPLFFSFPSPSSLLLSSSSSLVWPGSPFVFSALCPGRRLPLPGRSSIALHALLLSSCLSLCPGRPPSPSLLLALSLSRSSFSLFVFLSFSPACICGYRSKLLSRPSLQG